MNRTAARTTWKEMQMAGKYFVDWSDSAFPQIREIKFAYNLDYETPLTFAEAKREIIEHFERKIRSARQAIADTRALRASDIVAS